MAIIMGQAIDPRTTLEKMSRSELRRMLILEGQVVHPQATASEMVPMAEGLRIDADSWLAENRLEREWRMKRLEEKAKAHGQHPSQEPPVPNTPPDISDLNMPKLRQLAARLDLKPQPHEKQADLRERIEARLRGDGGDAS